MPQRPSRAEGHLVVAAIRVLEHTEGHPPMEPEIATHLHWHKDHVRILIRALEAEGIVSAVKTAFDVRFQVGDHAKIDELPAESGAKEEFASEMEKFDERSREEQAKLEKLLGHKGEKKEEVADPLAGDFDEFRKRKPVNPFGDD